jgi:L-alanine-DL-glutamate epimerase-like enolase superfamily enzyme
MAGVPVHELLGERKHDRLLAYATGAHSNYPKEELAKKIDFYLSLGFKAFKLGVGSLSAERGRYVPAEAQEAADFEGDKMAFVRQHVGPDIGVMMDGHMGNNRHTWDLPTAQAVLKAVEPFDLFFFEEPLHYTDPWGYAELCKTTKTPVAGGECLTAAYEWRVFAERDAFDIGQPDASFVGGLSEFLRVANMLEERGRKIATHAWGAAGSLMQNIHCAFLCGNTCILEIPPAFGPLHSEMLVPGAFQMQDGMVLPPQTPGMGVTLTEEIKQKYPFVPGSGEFNSVPGKILQG